MKVFAGFLSRSNHLFFLPLFTCQGCELCKWATRPLTRGAPSSSTRSSCSPGCRPGPERPRVLGWLWSSPPGLCWGAQLTGPAPLPVLGSPVGLRQGGRSLRTLVLSLRGTLTLARPAPRLQGVKTAICLRVGLVPQPTSSWCCSHHTSFLLCSVF